MAAPVTKFTHFGGAGAGVGSPTVSEETFNGWSFRSVSAPIASSSRIEEVETALSLPPSVPVPEALFADNSLTIRHDASGTALRINAVDALRSWHSRQSRIATDAGSLVCATSFDWAYENEYDGLVVRGPDAATVPFEDSPCGLPMELLRLREDIVWSCHLSLYEDDLHDMGVSECTVKARVMHSCFFVLLETFVRIDGERTMLRQARYCHKFGSTSVLRDVEVRSATVQEVIGRCRTPLFRHKHIMDTGPAASQSNSFFLSEALKWMEEASKDTESKLYCPSCNARVGVLNWVGVQIPGGDWVSPAIIIHKKAVDPRSTSLTGPPVVGASAGPPRLEAETKPEARDPDVVAAGSSTEAPASAAASAASAGGAGGVGPA